MMLGSIFLLLVGGGALALDTLFPSVNSLFRLGIPPRSAAAPAGHGGGEGVGLPPPWKNR